MTTEEVQQPETEWVYEEPTTTPEYIASACNGITSISDMDTALMSNADRQRVQRIKRKSLAILDYCIGLLYDELFDEETEKE
jgi:kynureninase